jgi:hypothetical protein
MMTSAIVMMALGLGVTWIGAGVCNRDRPKSQILAGLYYVS